MARTYAPSQGDCKDTDDFGLARAKYYMGLKASSATRPHVSKRYKGSRAAKKQREIRDQLRNY